MVALDEAFNVIKAPGQAMSGYEEQAQNIFSPEGAFGTTSPRPQMADAINTTGPDESPRDKADKASQKAKDHGDSALHSFTSNPVTQAIVDKYNLQHRDHGQLLNDILRTLGPDTAQDMGMKELEKVIQNEMKAHQKSQRLFDSSKPEVRHTPTREGAGSMPEDGF